MALKAAVANGNWSDPATWNNGTLPAVGDVVASNNFTVTIDIDVNVNSITNTVQSGVSIVPIMTSKTTPSGIVTSSTVYNNDTRVDWKAFSNVDYWVSANGSTPPQWIAYEFPTPRVVDRYSFTSGVFFAAMPKDFVFEGWDGSSWITLHTVTGNTGSTYTSPSIGNATAYIQYRIYTTATNQTNPLGDKFISMGAIKFYAPGDLPGPTTAGGTFILNGNVTLTCTGLGLVTGAVTLLTWNGGLGTTSTINSTSISAITAIGNSVVLSGLGTINIISELFGPTSSGAKSTIYIISNCIVNVVGNLSGGSISGDTSRVIWVNSVSTLNITGNLIGQTNSETNTLYISANAIVRITGNVIGNGTGTNNKTIRLTSSGPIATLEITGNIISNSLVGVSVIEIFTSSYFKQIGSMIMNAAGPCFVNTNTNAINISTGPFISSTYGYMPFITSRMFYFRTIGSYFQFRDETTNGALPPGAIAPSASLVSPDTIVDSPIPANVRQGITYALGTLTGTLIVPSPNSVALGVPTDNTTGSAVLTPSAIWNYATSNITDADTIGARLKNASTVDTTGAQLTAFL